MIGAAASVAGLAALLILLLGGWQIFQTRSALLIAAAQNVKNLTRSLAQHAARTIDGVDMTLSDAIEFVQANPGTNDVSAFLSRRTTSLNQLRRIALTDETGLWIADSLAPHEPRSSSIQPEFAWHRDHDTSGLHLEIIRNSRYDGALVIPASKRWNHPDGSFAGIISAGLTPDYFATFYRTVQIGKMGTVALFSDDGHLLVRYPQLSGTVQSAASRKTAATIFSERSGVIMARSPFDGVERILAYEHVDSYPLVVSTAISVDEALVPWRREAWIEGGVTGIAVFTLIMLGMGLETHRRRLLATARQIARQSTLIKTTLDNMDQALIKISHDGDVEFFNDRFVELFPLPPALRHEACLNLGDVLALLHESGEYGEADRAFRALIAERSVSLTLAPHEVSRLDGTILEVRTVAIADGAVVRTYADVTTRHNAELARREFETRYRLLADNSTDMVTHMDLTGRRLFVSPASYDLLGYRPHEIVGTHPFDMIHPEDKDQLQQLFVDLAGGSSTRAVNVNRLLHKDGHWVWVEASLKAVCAPDGGVTGFVAAIRNIVERKRADEAIRASEARYRVLAETTTDLITQLDLSMQRQYVSPACRHVLGFEPEELLGRQPSSEIHPDDADDVRALAARLIAGEIEGGRAVTTYRTRHKAGHWLWVEAGLNLIRDDVTGAPASLICSLRDVTERQRIARHLERAKSEAESAARAKTEFVANMSHELRTPLTGIIGVHDLMRTDPSLSAAQRRLVDLAGEAGRSLLAIVNDVLDFSKADAGKLVLERVPFDFDDVVASCCSLVRGQVGDKPLELSVSPGPRPIGWLAGDPTRVRQILLNLLTNAVKFTERGAITVDASYCDETGLLRVEVTDTGIGIPAERVATLFERFTQADASTTRRYGGTGLGLAISKRLTDLMGGRIGAQARPSGGSSFWFELPLGRSEGRLDHRAATPRSLGPSAGQHLLLAEDNAVNAEIVAAMLTGRGYRVSIVADGAAAVSIVHDRTAGIELVLMDLQMPIMDGFSATAAIRAQEAQRGGSRLPIVGLTANALAEDADFCLAAGMDAHVAKPIDWARLFNVLDEFLAPGDRSSADQGHVVTDAAGVLEVAKLEKLAALIGRDRLGGVMVRFVEDLRVRMAAALSGDEAELSRAVHTLASSAGQLGFSELSAFCAEADAQIRSGAKFDRKDELRSAADRAAAAAARSGFALVA